MRNLKLVFTSLSASAALALGLIACGGDGGDVGEPLPELEGPAQAAPEGTQIYLEASLAADSAQTAAINDLATKLSGKDDPFGLLIDTIEASAAEQGHEVDIKHDIAPWLGGRVGFFVPDPVDPEPSYGVAIETTDEAAASAYLDSLFKDDSSLESANYDGVDYTIDPEATTATAVVDGYVLVTTTELLESTVDLLRGNAATLASSQELLDARNSLPDDSLGYGFVDVGGLISGAVEQALSAAPDSSNAALQESLLSSDLVGALEETNFAIGVRAESDRVTFDTAVGGAGADHLLELAGSGTLLAEAPASAWLRIGFSDLGAGIQKGFDAFRDSADEETLQQLDAGLAQADALGFDSEQLLSWAGDGAFFVVGTTPQTAGGGIVLEVTDPEAATTFIDQIGSVVGLGGGTGPPKGAEAGFSMVIPNSSPQLTFSVGLEQDRLVALVAQSKGLQSRMSMSIGADGGLDGTEGALEPGFEPSLFLDFDAVGSLVRSSGSATPSDRVALRVLDALGVLVAGSESDDPGRGQVVVTVP